MTGSSTTTYRRAEPIFERRFIADSYACRKGKGTHAAVHRCQQFARRFRYLLKADVQKFFPSLDHQILKYLRLRLHPAKTVVFPVRCGIRFLSYRVFPSHRLLPKENVRRFRRRVRAMQEDYAAGRVSSAEIRQRLMSWSVSGDNYTRLPNGNLVAVY